MAADEKPCLENLPAEVKTITAGYVRNFTEEDEIVDCCSPVHVSQSWTVRGIDPRRNILPEFPSLEVANPVFRTINLSQAFKKHVFVFTSDATYHRFLHVMSNSSFFKQYTTTIKKLCFRYVASSTSPITSANLSRQLNLRLGAATSWKGLEMLKLELVDFDTDPNMPATLYVDGQAKSSLVARLISSFSTYRGRLDTTRFIVTGLTNCAFGNVLAHLFHTLVEKPVLCDVLGPATYMVVSESLTLLDVKPKV